MGEHNACSGALGIDEIFEANGGALSTVGPFDGTAGGSGISPNDDAETLGIDRIALVSAAAHKYQDTNVLVIDAGTCITYDFLNSDNEYLGGAISPGLSMRYKSLHTFTDKLPLLEANNPKATRSRVD